MPFGLHEFFGMAFGLKNVAQAFQRLMDTVYRGLESLFLYIADTLVASGDIAEHKLYLYQLFERLR